MKKQCSVYGRNKNGEDFKFRFMLDKEQDYLEQLCEELKNHEVELEDCSRVYFQEPKKKYDDKGRQ